MLLVSGTLSYLRDRRDLHRPRNGSDCFFVPMVPSTRVPVAFPAITELLAEFVALAERVATICERKRPHFFSVASEQEGSPCHQNLPAKLFLNTLGSFLLETSRSVA